MDTWTLDDARKLYHIDPGGEMSIFMSQRKGGKWKYGSKIKTQKVK